MCISIITSNPPNLVSYNVTQRKATLPISVKMGIWNYSKFPLDMSYICLVLISPKYIYLNV